MPIIIIFAIVVLIKLEIDLTGWEFAIALIVWLGLAIGFLKIALHFHCEKIWLFCLSSLLPLAFYLIIVQIFRFDSFGYFILFSTCIIVCLICCISVFVFEYFNIVKFSFVVGILCIVAIPFLLSPFIVSKLHIGNYTAKELIFTQEAEKSIAPCQPTQGANNTLILSDIKVISSLGEYILFECSGAKERQKVPMRFLLGEILPSM